MRWSWPILSGILALTALAAILAPFDPMRTDIVMQMQPPSQQHILGTDFLGRDVLSRLLFGGQRTLIIAGFAASLAVMLGAALGFLSGLANPNADRMLTSIINTMLAIPNLLLALVVLTVMGVGVASLIIATGFAQIAPVARVIRAAVIAERAEPYIEAGYIIGLRRWQIAFYYVLPNIQGTLSAYIAVTFSYCLLNSAALTYLGLGGEPGVPDWGVMLAEGRNVLREAPWVALAPGFAITSTLWAINRLFDQITEKSKYLIS